MEQDYILVIGGINIDIAGIPKDKLIDRDSSPGSVEISYGGVGRNIAENLARFKQSVKMLTLFGDDPNGRELRRYSEGIGVDFSPSEIVENTPTSTYLFVLDEKRDMRVAISSMDIYLGITPEFLESKREIIENSNHIVVDTNIPEESLEYLAKYFSKPIFVDCVSTTKAKKIAKFIGRFYGVKANKIEAEAIVGFKISTVEELSMAAHIILETGVKELYVTLGDKGVYFKGNGEEFIVPAYKASVLNTTGAGDAFMAGISYSFKKEFKGRLACMIGSAASKMAVESMHTINPLITLDEIENIIKNCEFKDSNLEEGL